MQEAFGAGERRNIARRHLGQMEKIEGLLGFDLTSLELYADAIAEIRQHLTRLVSDPRADD